MSGLSRSRIPGFYQLSVADRQRMIAGVAELTDDERALLLTEAPLSLETAARLTENTIGVYALPLGVALNFVVNGREVLVPMVTEEPSVIAAASNAARLARPSGGFQADADASVMIAQVQLVDVPDPDQACARLRAEQERIVARIDAVEPGMARRGGGGRGVEARVVRAPLDRTFVVVHLLVDVGDAMGANAINTIAERTAPLLADIAGGTPHLRILSNLTDRRLARATVAYRTNDLAMPGRDGAKVAAAVELASLFAEADPYRAATHNKGIMNGIDAVALATGNDWRALEAGAHAYAARDGSYGALATWRLESGVLRGRIELPVAVGTVGATVDGNPRARLALKLLGVSGAPELAGVLAAVGLAQNFAAIRALATEGIQKGHMSRHARAVATAAGARPDQVETLAEALIASGDVKVERARQLLASGTLGGPAS
ncbi:MAG: hydroxymethylglutaryl-CoA reductase, degradative [Deltaproteobacteria bacterium]|nr:hydroxymethylglutaryl-CoA reductase, degradative [Deltaproteobacteria bacterium]